MEIFNHRQKMLDATECNAKSGKRQFSYQSDKYGKYRKNCGRSKKKESNLFLF